MSKDMVRAGSNQMLVIDNRGEKKIYPTKLTAQLASFDYLYLRKVGCV
jgi:hypothetical protein